MAWASSASKSNGGSGLVSMTNDARPIGGFEWRLVVVAHREGPAIAHGQKGSIGGPVGGQGYRLRPTTDLSFVGSQRHGEQPVVGRGQLRTHKASSSRDRGNGPAFPPVYHRHPAELAVGQKHRPPGNPITLFADDPRGALGQAIGKGSHRPIAAELQRPGGLMHFVAGYQLVPGTQRHPWGVHMGDAVHGGVVKGQHPIAISLGVPQVQLFRPASRAAGRPGCATRWDRPRCRTAPTRLRRSRGCRRWRPARRR